MEVLEFLSQLVEYLFTHPLHLFLLAVFTNTTLFLLVIPFYITRYNPKKPHPLIVQVLVLGDVGRSPRMQYHAHSITKLDAFVELIGYKGKLMPLSFL